MDAGVSPHSLGFAARVELAVGRPARAIAIADINGDGLPDIVVADQPTATNAGVSILLSTTTAGSTTPTFLPAVHVITANDPQPQTTAVAVGDLDGDGRPDVLVSNFTTGAPQQYIALLVNTTPVGATTPTFALPVVIPQEASSIVVADMNDDGKNDVVVGAPRHERRRRA